MTTRELMSQLRSLNVRVWAEDGQLLCNGPKGSLSAELRLLLAERKAEVLDFLKDNAGTEAASLPAIHTIPRVGVLPVSYAQQRMWFLDRFEPNTPLYNISSNVRLEGPLDVAALATALNEIVRRHETLRTSLPEIDGVPVPCLTAALEIPLPITDLRGFPQSGREEEIRRLSAREAALPFDLGRGPLLRAMLLQAGDRDHVLLLTMHHIVSDGWSLFVLFRELATLYSAFSLGRPSPLPPLPVQYADFAQWQQHRLSGSGLRKLLDFWEKQLRNAPVLQLPSDRPRPAVQSYYGAEHYFTLGPRLTEALADLNRRENVTLFMTLLAAFFVLLHRCTGQEDIVVGYPIAGRNRAEVEGLIGLFVNTLVLRVAVPGTSTFREVLARVREAALEADAHQDLPFEKLIERLQPQRSLSHHPLFQVMFVLQNAPVKSPDFAGLKAALLRQPENTSKVDLMLTLREVQPQIEARLQYSTDLFNASTMERMSGQFRTILESIAGQPNVRIAELPALPAEQQDQLPVEWNHTAVADPRDESDSGTQFMAPRNHVERQLAGIWQTILNVEQIGVTDNFFDLGGHSLLAVRVTSKIEKIFGRRLPLATFFQAPTVAQMARILREEIQFPVWQSLFPIQTEGFKAPFFWIHGERSNDTLQRYLRADQPLYGIAHQSQDGSAARYTSVEQIAAHYLGEIRMVQPHGPYFLGGYCFGGMIAFEIAQQLTQCQEQVALVALLAPSIPQLAGSSRRWKRFDDKSQAGRNSLRTEFTRHIRNLDQLETREKVSYVGKRAEDKVSGWFAPVAWPVKRLLRRAKCATLLGLGYPVPVTLRSFYILDVYRKAMQRYQARPYRGTVALFLPHTEREWPKRAWGELAIPQPEVIEFPGEHTEILDEQNVQIWAQQLNALLELRQSNAPEDVRSSDARQQA